MIAKTKAEVEKKFRKIVRYPKSSFAVSRSGERLELIEQEAERMLQLVVPERPAGQPICVMWA